MVIVSFDRRMANPLEDEILTDEDLAALTREKFDYIRFTVADINCVSRSKTVPKEHVSDFLGKGMPLFDGKCPIEHFTSMTSI